MRKSSLVVTMQCVMFLGAANWIAPQAHAAINNVAWYRLGEDDPGAASGLAVTNTTADFVGTNPLKPFGSPIYTNAVSATASNVVGSSLAIHFNGSNQFLSNAVVSTAVDNFGLEAWVKPNTTAAGTYFIADNGFAGSGGWGLYQSGGSYVAFFGGLAVFGSGIASPGTWVHLALVRDSGTATLYVNGIAAGNSSVTPNPVTGGFAIGATPQPPATAFFNGTIDELRVFTFVPGQFSTNDLLLNRTGNVSTFPATGLTGTRARLNAGAVLYGEPSSAWFEWGPTTNYGNVTSAQALVGGSTNTTINHLLIGLTPDATYHFRAVISNQFGIAVGGDKVFTSLVWLYAEDFDTDHTSNWVANFGPGNNAADFFFDYSTVGIPPAPNSGGTTRGLKLEADYAGNIVGGISVSPSGRNFTGDYVLTFDLWWNFVGPAPAGGSGSTQVTGTGIGTSGATPQWAGGTQDSIHFGATGDGGSFADYRAYSSAATSGYQPASGVFAAGITMPAWDNLDAYYVPLTGNAPPAAQTALFPQQTGTPSSGAPAFKWHRGQIIKSSTNVTFSLDGLLIASIDPGTVTFGGGNILFNQFDVNALSSTDPQVRALEFGLIDNVVVSRPVGFVPTTAGDSNGDGIVDADELNVVLANYFATSPWLLMTNVAGLGGTNVTFTLTNDLAGAFLVEYTTNITDWYELGPAVPRYLFTDTNAPALPQRAYRLRWP